MGYTLHQKGYRLFDISTKQFSVSRDVIFHEDIFSFSSLTPSPSVFSPSSSFPLDEPSSVNNHPDLSSITSLISSTASGFPSLSDGNIPPNPIRQSTRISRPAIWTHF